ncbi:hypothetical protein UT300012_23400 [Paraclostridium bifermentans]
MNILTNEYQGANFAHRTVLEKRLLEEFTSFMEEKGFDYLETLERYVVGDNIIFYNSILREMQTESFKKMKSKDKISKLKDFARTCPTYELLYFYISSVEVVMCTQYEMNEDLIEDGYDFAVCTVKAYTLLANVSLLCLVLKHNLFEAEIEYLEYIEDKKEFEVTLRPAKMHIMSNRFDLPFMIDHEDLIEGARLTSEENMSLSVVELAVKFSQNLYFKAVYGKVWDKLFSNKPYTNEQEVFLSESAFYYREKEIPSNGAYIVTLDSQDIHSIYVRESVFEGMKHIDMRINYKDDTMSNMSIGNWRNTHNMAQGINPVEPLKYLHQYLGSYDYGLDYRVIEDLKGNVKA